MEIIALIIALVSFALCFIIWVVPFVGPIFVIVLAIVAIVISIITLLNINDKNKKNIMVTDYNPQKSTKVTISTIISAVSLIIAVIFLVLHMCIFLNFGNLQTQEDLIIPETPVDTEFIQAEYGVAYEIEDNIFLTINSAVYVETTLTIEYSLVNESNKESVFYLNSFYYTNNTNIDDYIYPYKNTMMPITVEPNAIHVSEIATIQLDEKPTSIGYQSISGESINLLVE